jgi:hypothetical protein
MNTRVLLLAAFIAACSHDLTPPSFPITVHLALVNQIADSVFVRMKGEESAFPGISRLAPSDSQCTELYASADSIPVEVHSWTSWATIYGTAWVYPLGHTAWQATVTSTGVTATRANTACSF